MKIKNTLRLFSAFLFAVVCVIGMTACGSGDEECKHNWTEATCGAPKTCSLCKETSGDALGHKYGDWSVVTEATCSVAGEKSRTCSVCNNTEKETLPTIDHSAQKHDAVEATHTTAGNIEYWSCGTCGKNYQSASADAKEIAAGNEVIPALGHMTAVSVAEKRPTHTENGNIAYFNCEDCGKHFDSAAANAKEIKAGDEVVLATGHADAVKVEVKASTHTENGNVEYYACADCGKNYVGTSADAEEISIEEATIAALGHVKAVKVAAKDPTHTENGNVEYYACADCGKNYVSASADSAEIPAGKELISALGHTRAEKKAAKQPTHTDKGNVEYYYCADCNKNYTGTGADAEEIKSGDEIVAALGHVNAVKLSGNAPTHTESGTDECWFCADCNKNFLSKDADAAEYIPNEEERAPLGHVTAVKVEAADKCTEKGNIEYYHCPDCNKNYVGTEFDAAEIPAGEELVDPVGHINAQKNEAIDAKCTESGNIEYYHCPDCGNNVDGTAVDAAVIPAGEELTEPKGHTKAIKFDLLRASHYEWGHYEYYECLECDGRKFTSRAADAEEFLDGSEKISPEGHVRAIKYDMIEATCCVTGHIEYWYCETCKLMFTGRAPEAEILTEDDIIILPTGHIRAEKISEKAPTHTENGNIEYWYCGACGSNLESRDPESITLADEEVIIPAIGHIGATLIHAVAPTETTPGNIEYYYCAECDKNFMGISADSAEIPAGEEILPATGATVRSKKENEN